MKWNVLVRHRVLGHMFQVFVNADTMEDAVEHSSTALWDPATIGDYELAAQQVVIFEEEVD
jgi:hypothetical protein